MTTAETENEVRDLPRVSARGCACDQIRRIPLFELEQDEGEPRVFTVPEHFEGHVALDYLEVLETRGPNPAFRWAMITALGREGWDAMRSPGMDDDLFTTIGAAVLDRVRGASARGPKA